MKSQEEVKGKIIENGEVYTAKIDKEKKNKEDKKGKKKLLLLLLLLLLFVSCQCG